MPARAPILFVLKADSTIWLCVDYRRLNKIMIKNWYPLLLVGKLLDRLGHLKIFIKLDLYNMYYRLYIKKGDKWKTAFKTRYSYFEYLIMPFGLFNAPMTF